MTRIKMCGISRVCDAETVNQIHPDYVGFIFVPSSKRYVTDARAEELKEILDPAIQKVGVFVNEKPERILQLAKMGVIDLIQLHGQESEKEIQKLKEKTGCPVIKAFRIDEIQDIEKARKSCADFVLLDSGSGGTRTTFNWELLKEMKRDYFLAGGLGLDNIKEAVQRFHPFAVDVSSGIETEGKKDPAKMKAFAAAVRQAERSETGHTKKAVGWKRQK